MGDAGTDARGVGDRVVAGEDVVGRRRRRDGLDRWASSSESSRSRARSSSAVSTRSPACGPGEDPRRLRPEEARRHGEVATGRRDVDRQVVAVDPPGPRALGRRRAEDPEPEPVVARLGVAPAELPADGVELDHGPGRLGPGDAAPGVEQGQGGLPLVGRHLRERQAGPWTGQVGPLAEPRVTEVCHEGFVLRGFECRDQCGGSVCHATSELRAVAIPSP